MTDNEILARLAKALLLTIAFRPTDAAAMAASIPEGERPDDAIKTLILGFVTSLDEDQIDTLHAWIAASPTLLDLFHRYLGDLASQVDGTPVHINLGLFLSKRPDDFDQSGERQGTVALDGDEHGLGDGMTP